MTDEPCFFCGNPVAGPDRFMVRLEITNYKDNGRYLSGVTHWDCAKPHPGGMIHQQTTREMAVATDEPPGLAEGS